MESTEERFLLGRVAVRCGDITREVADAIVNAANSTLLGGGGVDGAIHRAGGPEILEQCREIRRTKFPKGLPTGEAVITSGGKLPARHVIHTVGPIYGQHNGLEAELLSACYKNCLRLASEHNLASIAFPAISTGLFAYPRSEAAEVASQAIEDFLNVEKQLEDVRLILFSASDMDIFLRHHKFSA